MTVATAYDALLLDLDGTIWEGGRAIPGAVEAVFASGLPAMYVTNNASKAPKVVANQLTALGLAATADAVMTSAQAAVLMTQQCCEPGATVLVLGTTSFQELAREAGFIVTTTADDRPVAVLHGHNPETGWAELSEAALAIRGGAAYLASNLDSTLPMERGLHVGNGSMVAAVVNATGVSPRSAGKPEPAMFHLAAEKLQAQRPLAVGDRLDTDIAGGIAAGMDTLQVITGVSGHRDILNAPPAQRATMIAEDMTALFAAADTLRPGPQGGFHAEFSGTTLTISGGTADSTSIQAFRSALSAAWAAQDTLVDEIVAVGDVAKQAVAQWR
ncbi:HAD-IIA family hydrolase [Corynebacterium hindlerae]|uniref:HAD-IIA family hydrolase n=1 Tax=Corynebacterium hindlerae TaxID=699041 RepID=UPI001AD7048C|nr:HAD-IIA family hydrolase [Corynebacterium hindlerae]QTH58890.1 HAD-IIA family hydrolase [Corynebacterium hindlerae]